MTAREVKWWTKRNGVFAFGDAACQCYVLNAGEPMTLLMQVPSKIEKMGGDIIAFFRFGTDIIYAKYKKSASAFVYHCPAKMLPIALADKDARVLDDEEREHVKELIGGCHVV